MFGEESHRSNVSSEVGYMMLLCLVTGDMVIFSPCN